MSGPVRTEHMRVTHDPVVNPPRPPNAWIIYRAEQTKLVPGYRRLKTQGDVSREISAKWQSEPQEVRAHYERLAEEKKREHMAKYPGYRFQPKKKEDKKRGILEKKEKRKVLVQKTKKNNVTSGSATALAPHADSSLSAPGPSTFAPSPLKTHPTMSPSMLMSHSPVPTYPNLIPSSVTDAAGVANVQSISPQGSSTISPSATLYNQDTSFLYPSPVSPFPLTMQHHMDSQDRLLNMSLGWEPPHNSFPSASSSYMDSNYSDIASFDFSQAALQTMETWLENDNLGFTDNSLSAVLSLTDDPSIFQLHNFDPQMLMTKDFDSIEVSCGITRSISPLDVSALDANHLDFMNFDDSTQYSNIMQTITDFAPLQSEARINSYGDVDFNDYDEQASRPEIFRTSGDTVLPNSDTNSHPLTTDIYVPPSGAALASNRRVGASWRPPRDLLNDEPAAPPGNLKHIPGPRRST